MKKSRSIISIVITILVIVTTIPFAFAAEGDNMTVASVTLKGTDSDGGQQQQY